MTPKQHLRQLRQINKRIDTQLEQVEQLRAMAEKITTNHDHAKARGRHDKMAETVAKMVDLQQKINNDIDKYIDLKADIIKGIEKIEQADYWQILTLRYQKYESWENIAKTLGYTERWIFTLHGRALQEFQRVHCNSVK